MGVGADPQHVAGLLRVVLRAKSLIISICCGVAGFPDLSFKCRLDSGLHAAVAMSGRDGCDARVLQVQQISQIVAPL